MRTLTIENIPIHVYGYQWQTASTANLTAGPASQTTRSRSLPTAPAVALRMPTKGDSCSWS